jgi:hypothetical protein
MIPKSINELKEFGDKCIHTFVVVILFSYVFVVTKAAQIFNCTSIRGVLRMDSERSVICFQGWWWSYVPFSLATLVSFSIGVIILFSFVIFFKKRVQNSKVFNARFRFLFVRFRDERLYWEIVIILRKLLIAMSVIFFSSYPMLVVLFSLFVIFIAFVLQIHNEPFRRHFHNTMEYLVLLSTLILLFCALLFYVDDFPLQWNKDFLGVLCVFVIIISTVMIVVIVILDFIFQWWDDQKEIRKKKFDQILYEMKNTPSSTGSVIDNDVSSMLKFGLKKREFQATVITDLDDHVMIKWNLPRELELELKLKELKDAVNNKPSQTIVQDIRSIDAIQEDTEKNEKRKSKFIGSVVKRNSDNVDTSEIGTIPKEEIFSGIEEVQMDEK